MIKWYLFWIIVATLAGGVIPLIFKKIKPDLFVYLLGFTGAFLFGITILHLFPDVFKELGNSAGIYIVIGFFLQVFLQQLSHGMEHGHSHFPGEHQHSGLSALLLGLSLHAFMEGIPLGFHYPDPATLPSLFLGILIHKLPEALTLMTVVLLSSSGKWSGWLILIFFSMVTPVAALLASFMDRHFPQSGHVLIVVVAIVVGAFLHISTTIFFESGTQHHELSWRKTLAIAGGLGFAFLTLLMG
ncbi:MAG: ZIP family metal transporter [Chitinophagaceae bacterium]